MRNDLIKRVVVQESNVREGTAQLRVTIPKDIASVVGWEKGTFLRLVFVMVMINLFLSVI